MRTIGEGRGEVGGAVMSWGPSEVRRSRRVAGVAFSISKILDSYAFYLCE